MIAERFYAANGYAQGMQTMVDQQLRHMPVGRHTVAQTTFSDSCPHQHIPIDTRFSSKHAPQTYRLPGARLRKKSRSPSAWLIATDIDSWCRNLATHLSSSISETRDNINAVDVNELYLRPS